MVLDWRCPRCRRAKGFARSRCLRCGHGSAPAAQQQPARPPAKQSLSASGAAQFPKEWAGYLVGFALAFALQYLIIQTVGALVPSRAPLPSVWASLIIPTMAGKLGWNMFAER